MSFRRIARDKIQQSRAFNHSSNSSSQVGLLTRTKDVGRRRISNDRRLCLPPHATSPRAASCLPPLNNNVVSEPRNRPRPRQHPPTNPFTHNNTSSPTSPYPPSIRPFTNTSKPFTHSSLPRPMRNPLNSSNPSSILPSAIRYKLD
jgi:hypothetical protein